MASALGTYLNDHLAGAAQAIAVLERLEEEHGEDAIGQFAAKLVVEVRADDEVLRKLAERIGTESGGIKEVASRVGEKMARMKLGDSGEVELGTFESLEFLMLGVHGKLGLWKALAVASASDARLAGLDYEHLQRRAATQEQQVEAQRLALVKAVLGTAADGKSARRRGETT